MSALESSGRAVAAHTGLSAGELDADFVEAVARRVLQLVDDGFDRESQLLTVAQVAHRFQVHPSWVYSNAKLLGVVRLGNGPRAPLRFDPARVAHVLHITASR